MESDYQIQLMSGVEKLENFDAYLAKWLAAGGQDCLDQYNEWYATVEK